MSLIVDNKRLKWILLSYINYADLTMHSQRTSFQFIPFFDANICILETKIHAHMTYFLRNYWQKNTPIWLTKRIFSYDLTEKIPNNFNILDNSVHSNVMTIINISTKFFSLRQRPFINIFLPFLFNKKK